MGDTTIQRIRDSPLYHSHKKIVVARGKPNSNLMIVGEAPGVSENKIGVPFVGRSGKLLELALQRAGVTECVITNVVPLMPLDEEGKVRKPSLEEIRYFDFFIERMISKHNPSTVLLLGQSAVQGVLGPDEQLSTWVNTTREVELFGKKRKVITLYHPAFHLRRKTEPEFISNVQTLLCQKRIELEPEKVVIGSNENDIHKFDIKAKFVLDVETEGINWHELTLTDLSFCDGEKAFYFSKEAIKIHKETLQQTILQADLVIGHNLIFDLLVLEKNGFNILNHLDKEQLFDTKVAAWVLDENRTSALKPLSELLLGEKMIAWKEARLRGQEAFMDYNLTDTIQTYKLYLLFREELEKEKLKHVHEREMGVICPTALMTYYGAPVDQQKLEELASKVKDDLLETDKKMRSLLPRTKQGLFEQVPVCVDFNSPQQLSDLLFNVLKLAPPKGEVVGKAGYFSTGETVLQKMKQSHKIIPLLLHYRKLCKLYNAYIVPFRQKFVKGGYIHPWFRPTGTVSGRFASSSPNFQQLPNDGEYSLREVVAAPEGWKMAVFDYSQIELRVAAIITNEPKFIEAFAADKDLHLMTANAVFNLELPERALLKGTAEYQEAKNKYKKLRYLAKSLNFAVLYGTSKYTLAEMLQQPVTRAEHIIETFFKTYPTLAQRVKATHDEARRRHYVENLYGRRRRFALIDNHTMRQSFNFKVQSSAAELMKLSITKVHELIRTKADEIKMIMTIHDELCFLVREDKVDEYVPRIKQIMGDFPNLPVKIEADYAIGENYTVK